MLLLYRIIIIIFIFITIIGIIGIYNVKSDRSISTIFSNPFNTMHYNSDYDTVTVYHTLDNN